MSLTKSVIKRLSQTAHSLKPIIIIGQKGLTQEVQDETDNALSHHELIKICINAADKSARKDITDTICTNLNCTLIQSIGHVIVVYREKVGD